MLTFQLIPQSCFFCRFQSGKRRVRKVTGRRCVGIPLHCLLEKQPSASKPASRTRPRVGGSAAFSYIYLFFSILRQTRVRYLADGLSWHRKFRLRWRRGKREFWKRARSAGWTCAFRCERAARWAPSGALGSRSRSRVRPCGCDLSSGCGSKLVCLCACPGSS